MRLMFLPKADIPHALLNRPSVYVDPVRLAGYSCQLSARYIITGCDP
jgi:hypothetical protein